MRTLPGSIRRSALALCFTIPTVASAQSLAIFGSSEATGYGEGSLFLGSSLSASGPGWRPYVSVGAYTYRYQSALGHSSNSAIAPSAGLSYNMPQQSVQFGAGYVFQLNDAPRQTSSGAAFGSQNSPFVSGQYSFWGDGSKDVLLLGSYSTKSKYLWTRGGALGRVGGSTGKLFAGGEVGVQGSVATPSYYRISAGPAFSYRISDTFRIGGGAGVRFATGNNSPPATGYARLDFLALPKLH